MNTSDFLFPNVNTDSFHSIRIMIHELLGSMSTKKAAFGAT